MKKAGEHKASIVIIISQLGLGLHGDNSPFFINVSWTIHVDIIDKNSN